MTNSLCSSLSCLKLNAWGFFIKIRLKDAPIYSFYLVSLVCTFHHSIQLVVKSELNSVVTFEHVEADTKLDFLDLSV